jgi:hypothetical protein
VGSLLAPGGAGGASWAGAVTTAVDRLPQRLTWQGPNYDGGSEDSQAARPPLMGDSEPK